MVILSINFVLEIKGDIPKCVMKRGHWIRQGRNCCFGYIRGSHRVDFDILVEKGKGQEDQKLMLSLERKTAPDRDEKSETLTDPCPKGPLSWLSGTAWILLHEQLLLLVHRKGMRLSVNDCSWDGLKYFQKYCCFSVILLCWKALDKRQLGTPESAEQCSTFRFILFL